MSLKTSKNVKIAVFVPTSHADKVRMAIGDSGGGHIGNYSHCVFVTPGTGYFLPLEGANPFIGKVAKSSVKSPKPERIREVKMEFICPKSKTSKIIKAIKETHPYEEVALDIFQILEE